MPEVIAGMSDLQKNLQELEYSMQRKALIEAAKAGAELLVDEAARTAPKRTGDLAAGITMRVSGRESDIYEATVDVGPDKSNFYGSFLQYGTKDIPASNWFGRAFETVKSLIVETIAEKLAAVIERFKNAAR
jgi:HK97 gp10 family phage protein